MNGTLRIRMARYQCPATRRMMCPLAERLDLPAGEVTPSLARRALHMGTQMSFAELHEELRMQHDVRLDDSVLNELMQANGLKQKDMLDVFGTPSIVSEILHGKRQLTTEHIRRLSRRFHVSPEVFIQF